MNTQHTCWFWVGLLLLLVTTGLAACGDTTTSAAPVPTTVGGRIQLTVQNSGINGTDVSTNYDEQVKTVTVIETLSESYTLDTGTVVMGVKSECFRVQKALWTSSDASDITSATLTVSGTLTDKYGNDHQGMIGQCDLHSDTAQKFNWDSLSFDQAWGDYDSTYLLPSLTK
jgi:hypothetical protein